MQFVLLAAVTSIAIHLGDELRESIWDICTDDHSPNFCFCFMEQLEGKLTAVDMDRLRTAQQTGTPVAADIHQKLVRAILVCRKESPN
jgi:hypothetical protein